MKKNIKIGMSIALASLLSLSMTGCTTDEIEQDSSASSVDVVVERGKVYDAEVKDSSQNPQIAIQKRGKNIYTFRDKPVYPIIVKGGWIDVNDDGSMDENDVKLDIEMKSYTNKVTPITTYMASASDKSEREEILKAFLSELNKQGVGSDTPVTLDDLLKVPSKAPKDVMIAANAAFKDMKENKTHRPDLSNVMSQFETIYNSLADDANAIDAERIVMENLNEQGEIEKVSKEDLFDYIKEREEQAKKEIAETEKEIAETEKEIAETEKEIFENKKEISEGETGFVEKNVAPAIEKKDLAQDSFEAAQKLPDAVVPILAKALLLNNISGLGSLDSYRFNPNYTLTYLFSGRVYSYKWRVLNNTLTVSLGNNKYFDFVFTNETPVDGEKVSETMYGINNDGSKTIFEGTIDRVVAIAQKNLPEVPKKKEEFDINKYSTLILLKNTTELVSYNTFKKFASESGFGSTIVAESASCTDYGFSNPMVIGDVKTYTDTTNLRTCIENDQFAITGKKDSANVLAYYGI